MTDVTAPQFQTDANNFAEVANGDINTTVTMRLGQNVDSVAKTINDIKLQATDEINNLALSFNLTDAGFDFATGGTLTANNQLVSDGANSWQYQNAIPAGGFVVAPGTVPSSPTWEIRVFNDHSALASRNSTNAHEIYTTNFNTIDDLRNEINSAGVKVDLQLMQNQGIKTLGYYAVGDSGGSEGIIKVGDSTSIIDNEGSVILISSGSSNGVWVEMDDRGEYAPIHFGARPNQEDSARIKTWLESGLRLKLDNEYQFTTLEINKSDIELKTYGGGVLVSLQSSFVEDIIKITGDRNKININVDIQQNMLVCRNIIQMVGNDNKITKSNTNSLTPYNPVNEGEQYLCTGIYINGSRNSARYNSGLDIGTGIRESGFNNKILYNEFNNVCCGVSNLSDSRYAKVIGNNIDCNFKGSPLQGCDGIWGNRSHRFTTYSGNTIKRAGEHGAYLQGDTFTWDETNFFESCFKAALKVGSKTTGNFAYPGETLPQFDPEGDAVSSGGQYAVTASKIFVRARDCNQTNGSDATLSLQTNIADIDVLGCDIRDSGDGSVNAIRSLYLLSEPPENQFVMANVKLRSACKVRNSGGVRLSCASGLVVEEIDVKGENVSLYAQDGRTNNGAIIKVGDCENLILTRTLDPEIIGVNVDNIDPSNCLNAKITGGKLRNQVSNFDSAGRIVKLERVEVNYLGNASLIIDSVREVESVVFNIPNSSVTFPLQYAFNSDNPEVGQFNGNIIDAPNSTRPARVGGKVACVNSNTIRGDASTDFALTIQGSDVTSVGNAFNFGSLRLDTNSTNCFAVGKSISDAGTGNVAITS